MEININIKVIGSVSIIGFILYLFKPIYNNWVIKRQKAIDEFRNIFISERNKIKRFNIQDYILQEQTIFKTNRYLFFWQRFCLRYMWNNYKKTEGKYRQATRTNGSIVQSNILVHYDSPYKKEILSKIDKIINYLK